MTVSFIQIYGCIARENSYKIDELSQSEYQRYRQNNHFLIFYRIRSMSIEEFGGLNQGIDTNSWANESQEQVTDAAREAVAEQARQWKVIAGKIANSKAQNNAFAKFLAFLLSQLQSDELIGLLYKLFFTTKDPYHGTVYIRKSSNYPVLIGLFVPFFRDKVVEYKMQSLYSSIYDPTQIITPHIYLTYLKQLAHAMHDNIALDQQLLLQCIMHIFQEFHVVEMKTLDDIQLEEIKTLIKKELY